MKEELLFTKDIEELIQYFSKIDILIHVIGVLYGAIIIILFTWYPDLLGYTKNLAMNFIATLFLWFSRKRKLNKRIEYFLTTQRLNAIDDKDLSEYIYEQDFKEVTIAKHEAAIAYAMSIFVVFHFVYSIYLKLNA